MGPAVDVHSSDDLLAHHWRRGNRRAANELVRKCEPSLHAFFRRRAARDVEDLVQVTLVACLEAVNHFEGRSTFKNFLLGIAHNQLLMELRSSRSRERKNRLYGALDLEPSAREFEQQDPNDMFSQCEEARIVEIAMNDMPPAFREVLKMFYWEDLPVERIASIVGVPVGTVKSRLARGRSLIAARIRTTFVAGLPASSRH